MDKESHPNTVLVAIPALDWRINASIATFLYQLAARSTDPTFGWQCSLAVVPEVSPVHYARNLLVGIFLRETNANALWFIDNDMMPEPGAEKILESEADVVSGHCLATKLCPDGRISLRVTAYTERDEHGHFRGTPPLNDIPSPIVAAGAANLLIRRRVLEDPRMHYDSSFLDLTGTQRSVLDDSPFAPPVFRTHFKPNGQVQLSEDLDFVYRAHALGYRCLYDPRARMGHLKTADLNGIAQMLAVNKRVDS